MSGSQKANGVRAAAAVVFAAVAVALLWPTESARPPRCWLDLISPLTPGGLIAGDYRLSPPRRGEEHDVVFVARRLDGRAVVELHVLVRGQWQGASETASFGVDYEQPRSTAPKEDLVRVTRALTKAIEANDPGGLGPVDAIALDRAAAPPKLTKALRKGSGAVGLVVALCLVAAALLVGTLRRGALWLGMATFAAGLLLRLAYLDLPFLWDQDVQRIQIGASSLGEIFAGVGLHDRRPPLLFAVLHFAQWFGQAEWIVRLPAALAGALLGPVIIWLSHRSLGRLSPLGVLAATLAALSPILVARSREVSELSMLGMLLVVFAALMLGAAKKDRSRTALVALAACCALALWLSYLAAAALVAGFAVAALSARLDKKRLIAFGVGALVGLPSLVLGAQALIRDMPAREAARQSPNLAWGNRAIAEVLASQWQLFSEAVGVGIVLCSAAACAWAIAKKQHLVAAAVAMVVSVVVTIAALTPFARVQPYYVVAVIPLLLLALSVLQLEGRNAAIATALVALAAVWSLSTAPPRLANLYVQEDGAFMREFAQHIRRERHQRVVTVTHYDATLLSYYLARAEGVSLRADRLDWTDGVLRVHGLAETIVSLLRSHAPNQDPAHAALDRLRRERSRGAVMVIIRTQTRLPELVRHVSECEVRIQVAAARLLLCPTHPGSRR